MRPTSITDALLSSSVAVAQQIAQDPGVRGPPLEITHLYDDQMPTGIAVSESGRLFSNYPSGLDANNTRYQVAELTTNNTETPYPNAEINSPPGGAINYTTYPPTPMDLGYRPSTNSNGTLVPASYGGPKLVAVDLATNTINQTIALPTTVAYPDSYINDVRIDLRPNVTASGQGVAYITDSSQQPRNGIIIVDLGTKEAWRHLDGTAFVSAEKQHLTYVWGEEVYFVPGPGEPFTFDPTGADGIALLDGGDTIVWSIAGGRQLYSIANQYLLNRGQNSEVEAQANVMSLGQKGQSDGLMQDTNQYVYAGNSEQNAINIFNARNSTVTTYVRNPRIGWTDSLWISNQTLYFIENQLWRGKGYYPGTDRRVKPYVLYRVPTADGGSRVSPMEI
ncbi:hypothetical protein LTR70_000627 [Exophiala xenobiotica]|uniref:Major royal jelly protein n=1 Tax=Lithohypha guttulata TaxID=1690604 RepID=A0ABR0KKB3_9EURO|nr:hypothetical protein LTR24_002126 [Lithohypha guttulata]KAK5329478.1 hypothetical protein LTR70_000627 [Exophiala xenobiotica]